MSRITFVFILLNPPVGFYLPQPPHPAGYISLPLNAPDTCQGRSEGMNTLTIEASATKIWFDKFNMWVNLSDGRQLSIPLEYFPRLLNANPTQRKKYILSGNGTGIHWDELDEDISVSGLLMGKKDLTC